MSYDHPLYVRAFQRVGHIHYVIGSNHEPFRMTVNQSH